MYSVRVSGGPRSTFGLSSYMFYVMLLWLVATKSVVYSSAKTWPWLAFIPSLNCTGMIVHSRWLLTASQCFRDKSKIPSELFIDIQDLTAEGKLTGVRRIFVIDYTRDERLESSTHGLAMLFLARTVPSLTREFLSLRPANSTLREKSGIVLSWDSRLSKIEFNPTLSETPSDISIIALSIDIVPCVDPSSPYLCASLDKQLSTATPYCARVSLGSPLVVFDGERGISLVGVLHQRSDCRTGTKPLGRFTLVNRANDWIQRQFLVQDFPQCQPNVYRNLDDPSRDLRKQRTGPSVLCDTTIPRAWYRFTLQGQPAELPTSCPEVDKCGSSSSIWLPHADGIEIGKQVEIRACATWSIAQKHFCCFWMLSIFVRHCGDYKVYRLRRTDACPTSYCSNVAKGHCGVGKIGYKPNCRDSHPKLPKTLQFYPFFTHQETPPNPYLYLRCLMYTPAARNENIKYLFNVFKIERKHDGTVVKRTIRSLETTRNYCDTLLLPGRYDIGLGDTVVCETRSFFRSSKDRKSPPLSSKIYHLGIEIHPSTMLVLKPSQSVNITFIITLPVICQKRNSNCSLVIPLTTSLTDMSTGQDVQGLTSTYFTLSKCSLMFTPRSCSRDEVVCGRETVQLRAENNLRNADVRLRIQLGPVLSSDAVWKDNSFPVVDTILKPTSRFTCYAMAASNMKTFDASFFKHLGEGTFLFHRGISSSLEVQLRKWRCDRISTCTCGVAVREGNDVIIADMCAGQYKRTSLRIAVRSKLPLHPHMRIVESNDGKTFAIRFPSGSFISIDEFEWGINVYLTTLELGDSRGLCHAVTTHATTRDKLGRTPSIRKIKDVDSLFEGSILPLKLPLDENKEFCACSGLKTLNRSSMVCPPSAVYFEDGSNDITKKIVDNQRVLRTSAPSITLRSRESGVKILQADGPGVSSTYEQQREVCGAILNGTDASLVCKDVLGEELWENMWQMCLQDTQEGLHLTLLQSNRKAITQLCKEQLEQRIDRKSLIRRWREKFCENRCARNGKCHNGICECNVGYGSSDCSVPLHKPPKLFVLKDSICDGRNEFCEEIFISGTPFLNSKSLSCSFTPIQRSGNTWKENYQEMFTTKALFYSLRGVICEIPREKRSDFVKSEDAFYIRVSNTGRYWSNPVLWVSYNSLCKNCSTTGYCFTKPGTCDINSRCFIHGDIHPNNRCLICTAPKHSQKWSPREDNLPPVFTSPAQDNVTVFVNEFVSFLVKAVDSENRPLKITHNVPLAQFTANGEFRWKPTEESTKTIQLLATDECGRTAAKYIDLTARRCLCENGGRCPQTTNSTYQCLCTEAFLGRLCERRISPCSSNPCVFGACVNNGSDYRCICDVGYRGDRCRHNISRCNLNPCKRGLCIDFANDFRCECPLFYHGRFCETKVDPCDDDPCVRGTCRRSNESFECVCPQGFQGTLCSRRRITPCLPDPCHGGRCVALGASMRCICPVRHHGKFCNLTGVYCANKSCVNGVCESTRLGQRCVCQSGFAGEQCDILCGIACVHGKCVHDTRGTSCECHEGFSGPDCSHRRTSCAPNPCAHGACIAHFVSFVCRCDTGYSGTLCNTSACSHSDCGNGTCVLANGIPVCRCDPGFLGNNCERRHQRCDSNPCFNGVCINGENSFECRCYLGYHGPLCDKADPCISNPCENGVCTVEKDGYFSCVCHAGYTGRLCTRKQNSCLSNPCVYGSCVVISNGDFHCKCDRGFVGVLCEKRFNICSSNPCVNGRCFSFYEGTFHCSCTRGFTGTRCEIDRTPCSTKPCFPGVACINVLGIKFTCGNCPTGFVGDGIQCRPDENINHAGPGLPCPRQFCFPGVKCSIMNSQIHCGKCPHDYYGNGFDCRVLCKFSCLNGGTCVEPGVCRCLSGFLGATCSRALCKKSCLNGGRCISPNQCHCTYGFYGNRCEKARCNVKCLNGGRCIPPNRCQCSRGYTGLSCEQAVCTLPCLNGGQCVGPGRCRCPPGYFGTRCQEGTCYPQCRNGGICARNNFCACPKGYRGNRCQTAICQHQCQNGGRCFKRDRCSCPYGYWGETCQFVNCLQPCYNGGVCIKPSVCLCPEKYAGVSCQLYVG